MILKRALGALTLVTLASGLVLAQSPSTLKIAHTTKSKTVTKTKNPSAVRLLWSNLGPSPTDAYNGTEGYYILGPNNSVGYSEQYIAIPFTPHVNETASELQVAVQYESGTNKFIVGIYADNNGAPGTLIASGEGSDAPAFGSCCQTVNVSIPSTALSQGVQYWVGVSSDDTNASDFTGVFVASNLAVIGYDEAQDGWASFSTETPAAAVWGTVN